MPDQDEKTCETCGKKFSRGRSGRARWEQRKTCSVACSVAYRKRQPPKLREGLTPAQRSKKAMNSHWNIQKAKAAGKKVPIGDRASEREAIEEYLARVGATRCEPTETPRGHSPEHRSDVQPAWRG